MTNQKLADGTVHKMPADLQRALSAHKAARVAWGSLTPLARNEWICWNITVKQEVTRKDHIKRTVQELQEGKRRPCCWMGCIHRTDKALSPSIRGILSKKANSSTSKIS